MRPASCDLVESRGVVHRPGAEPHCLVAAASRTVDRIRLEQPRAAPARVGDRALEQAARNALAAVLGRHHEADDRPHRGVVHGLHDGGTLQSREVVTRTKRYPSDRLPAAIRDESGRLVGAGERPERGSTGVGARASTGEFRRAARATVVHAPAAPRRAAAAGCEKRLEVGPASDGQRAYGEVGHVPGRVVLSRMRDVTIVRSARQLTHDRGADRQRRNQRWLRGNVADRGRELCMLPGIDRPVPDTRARGVLAQVVVALPVLRRPDGPLREAAAAVRADVAQDSIHTGGAERAFVAADACVCRIGRQCLVAVLAGRSKLEHASLR